MTYRLEQGAIGGPVLVTEPLRLRQPERLDSIISCRLLWGAA